MTTDDDEMSAASRGSHAAAWAVEPPIANHYDGRMWVDADRYTELLETYAALVSETRWIPVTERLPKDDENVLVFDPECHFTHIAWCHKDSTGEIVWAYYGLEPTHWMPLPATPTDDK